MLHRMEREVAVQKTRGTFEGTRLISWLGLSLLVAHVGCAAGSMGMDRGPLTPVQPGQAIQVDDQRIAQALAQRPQLPDRILVGVYFRDPSDDSWTWDFDDRRRVVEASDDIEGVDLFPISQAFVEGTDLMSLRLAAAHHGAHALVVVEGRVEQRTRDNAWMATYPLLLPILFAPAQELDTWFNTDAMMYDVRNGFLYLSAESEAHQAQQRAHIWIDGREGVEVARGRAIEHLREELVERLQHLVGENMAEPSAPAVADETSPADTTEEPPPSGTPLPTDSAAAI